MTRAECEKCGRGYDRTAEPERRELLLALLFEAVGVHHARAVVGILEEGFSLGHVLLRTTAYFQNCHHLFSSLELPGGALLTSSRPAEGFGDEFAEQERSSSPQKTTGSGRPTHFSIFGTYLSQPASAMRALTATQRPRKA